MFDGQEIRVENYQTATGEDVVNDWLNSLRDRQARAKIQVRIARLRSGNPGSYRGLDGGISELKINYGPGYRIYFAQAGEDLVLLLCGGDKSTQETDIKTAKKYWADYQERR